MEVCGIAAGEDPKKGLDFSQANGKWAIRSVSCKVKEAVFGTNGRE